VRPRGRLRSRRSARARISPQPSGDVVAREIEGELSSVLLVAGSGDREDELFTLNELFALNAAGKAIWDQFDGQRRLAEVVAHLSPELEEAEDGAGERDVLGLIAELLERRMPVAA